MYTIGEISKMKGFTVKALRFYEKIGLFEPAYIDPKNQYRYYTKEQLPVLDIIKSARSLEISPKDLLPIINSKNSSLVFSELEKQKRMLKDKIEVFNLMINQIDAIETSYKDASDSIVEKGVYERHIEVRQIVSVDAPQPLTVDNLNTAYSHIEKKLTQNRYINPYQYGLLLKDDKNGAYPEKVFIVINGPKIGNVDSLEGGRYICVNYTEKNAKKKQKLLKNHLLKHNLLPKKIIQMEVLTDIFDTSGELFEIQVLV